MLAQQAVFNATQCFHLPLVRAQILLMGLRIAFKKFLHNALFLPQVEACFVIFLCYLRLQDLQQIWFC